MRTLRPADVHATTATKWWNALAYILAEMWLGLLKRINFEWQRPLAGKEYLNFSFLVFSTLHFTSSARPYSRKFSRLKCMNEGRAPLCRAKIRTSARNCWRPAEDGKLEWERLERVANTTKVVWWEIFCEYFSFANHFAQFILACVLRAVHSCVAWRQHCRFIDDALTSSRRD